MHYRRKWDFDLPGAASYYSDAPDSKNRAWDPTGSDGRFFTGAQAISCRRNTTVVSLPPEKFIRLFGIPFDCLFTDIRFRPSSYFARYVDIPDLNG